MRRYGSVPTAFWTDRMGRAIERMGWEARMVALHLQTSAHSNMIGFYFLPLDTLAHETRVPEALLEPMFARFADLGFAEYDAVTETVWVREMAVWQIGETVVPRDKRHKALLKEAAALAASSLHARWWARYREAYHLDASDEGTPTEDEAPEAPSSGPPLVPPTTEQEQNHRQGQGTDKTNPPPPPSDAGAPARETPMAVADREAKNMARATECLAEWTEQSGGRFNASHSPENVRNDLARALPRLPWTKATNGAAGRLLAAPERLWDWADAAKGTLTCSWFLARDGVALRELFDASAALVAKEQRDREAAEKRAEDAEKARKYREEHPPMTQAQIAEAAGRWREAGARFRAQNAARA